MSIIQRISEKIPEFCLSHWLFRIPFGYCFHTTRVMSKLPVSIEDAESFGLPEYLVWWVVTYGELGAGIGLIVGGVLNSDKLWPWIGDMLTRFSGITICCIMTGVIWVGEPESLLDVILYDNFHVFLWVGGLFFALRGNRAK